MLEIGVRELKSRLSYYLRLMEAGEIIAIKVRDHIVGFLTSMKHPPKTSKGLSPDQLKSKVEQLKAEGFLSQGDIGVKMSSFKPIKLKTKVTASELVRQIRDEGL